MSYTKKLPIISEQEFLEKASTIKEFSSPRGQRYKVLSVEGKIMKFKRLDAKSGKSESFSLHAVYVAYDCIEEFLTENFEPFVPRQHSPARALLLALKLIG